MTTISGFNDMMEQFLEELVHVFPEEPAMKKYRNAFEMLRKANSRACMENFMQNITPYSKQVMAKDASFFLDNPDVFTDFKLSNIWTADLSDHTKDAIWQYLQTLYILGNTISALPENTLNMIEKIAKQCAGEMSTGTHALDINALTSMFAGQLEKKS
jgi:hypothetical protein